MMLAAANTPQAVAIFFVISKYLSIIQKNTPVFQRAGVLISIIYLTANA